MRAWFGYSAAAALTMIELAAACGSKVSTVSATSSATSASGSSASSGSGGSGGNKNPCFPDSCTAPSSGPSTGSGSGSGSSSGPSTVSVSSSVSSSSSTGAGGAGSCAIDSNDCGTCIGGKCQGPLTACQADASCQAATGNNNPTTQCICAAQKKNDQPGVQKCIATFVALGQLEKDLADCAKTNCAAACGI